MPAQKTFYFVRHGEGVDNAAPVFQSSDSSLSDKWRKRAETIAGQGAEMERVDL